MKALLPFYEDRGKVLLVLSRTDENRNGSWQAVAAVACFVVAVLAGIAGTLFTTGWILNPVSHPSLHAIGLVLLILAFPILILGAHCLDLRERKQNSPRNDSRFQQSRKTPRVVIGLVSFLHILSLSPAKLRAQEASPGQAEVSAQSSTEVINEEPSAEPSLPKSQYGAFVDLGYLLDFNHPANHPFRSRGTAFRVDSVF